MGLELIYLVNIVIFHSYLKQYQRVFIYNSLVSSG